MNTRLNKILTMFTVEKESKLGQWTRDTNGSPVHTMVAATR